MSESKTDLAVTDNTSLVIDTSGADISRALALVADKKLKDAASSRSHDKQLAGLKSEPKGLMLQINKRIKLALGISVSAQKDDEEIQELVALIRSKIARTLKAAFVNWGSADAPTQDRAIKSKIYDIIERMVAAYKATKGVN